MAGVIATIPKFQFSANGAPLVGGTLEAYIAGSTTPATTWQDSALTIANTNPISLDARGECVLWLDPAVVYKFVLKNAQGVIQWTQDNISNPAALANSLRADLAASSGASLVGFLQAGAGAVATTVQSKLRESVSVKDFGAIGDGVLHPLSERFGTLALAQAAYPHATSLSQSIDWAAHVAALASGCATIKVPKGHYMMTDTVRIPFGMRMEGVGRDYWDSYKPNPAELVKSDAEGTHWYFCGTGAKQFTCDDLANVLPARTIAGTAYEFTKFTLEDSVGGAPATPRPFSVGFIVERNASLSGGRVIPSYNKLQGYIDGAALSDEWDVGVWALSANDCNVYDLQSVGHWRMAGVLLTEHYGSYVGPQNPERSNFRRVWGAGVRGLLARNSPQYRATAYTSSSVSVAWTPSFCLTRATKFKIGSVVHTYTGYTFNAVEGVVTLTGVSPAITSLPLAIRAWNSGNNLSNSAFSDCVFSSLDHQSYAPSESFGLPVSGAAEYDGYPLRNIVHINTVFQTTADKLNTLWGGAYDFKYIGCKHENGELIAYNNTEHPHFTMNLRMVAEDSVFDSQHLGGFNPRSAEIDCYQQSQTFTDGAYRFRPLPGRRIEIRNQADSVLLRSSPSNGEAYLSNGSDDGSIQIQDTGTHAYRAQNYRWRTSAGASNLMALDDGGLVVSVAISSAGAIRPTSDNAHDLGSGPVRWRTVFAATGTINTSDAREKTPPEVISENVLDAWGDVQLTVFQWLESVREKGADLARWHFGVIAQQVRDAFASHGIDGTRYGLLCYDKWPDEFAPILSVRDVERDVIEVVGAEDDGTPIERIRTVIEQEEYNAGEVQLVRAAGSRWGIRTDQCLFLEAAYQRREMQRIRARLEALENQTGPAPVF